jgi:hypothetical protein
MSNFNRNANVILTFEGLAVNNYNKDTKNWEFLFLRHLENHELILTIKNDKPEADANKPIKHVFKVGKEHDIFFNAKDAIVPENSEIVFEIPELGLNDVNSEDIHWMDDYFHGKEEVTTGCSFNEDFEKRNLSFLEIQGHCTLYTHKRSEEEFEIWERTDNKKNFIVKRKIGVILGAAIEYPIGELLKINIVGRVNISIDILIENNVNYEIAFDNSCRGNPTSNDTSDFQHYQDIFAPTGRTVEILPVKSDGRPGDTPACKVCENCNGFVGSLRDIGRVYS